MEVISFNVGRLPQTYFFRGSIATLSTHIKKYGSKIILLTGSSSLKISGKRDIIESSLISADIYYESFLVTSEPSPEFVDDVVGQYKNKTIDVVVSIGGGSVIDAGKAIAAMLPLQEGVRDYLEIVGTKQHSGVKIPFIAVPTTAGTGSEATKNAVLSKTGKDGFKRSLRHENFVPDIAIIDPELMVGCPVYVTAASGLDALTQLIESYVSTHANPFTDALAVSGIERIGKSLLQLCIQHEDSAFHRANMAYGAYISGITLAHAGLGVVHGLASPLGALFGIPHGVACGTLLASATKATIQKLISNDSTQYLQKYAHIGSILAPCNGKSLIQCCNKLIDTLQEMVERLHMPPLSKFGVTSNDCDKIIKDAPNKNNPVVLTHDEIKSILHERL
ncbi:MAG: iron-containing alcohol dehydrogenase [Spirochaetota bacterium]